MAPGPVGDPAAYQQAAKAVLARFADGFDRRGTWESRWLTGLNAALRYAAAHPDVAELCYGDAVRQEPELRELQAELRREFVVFLTDRHRKVGVGTPAAEVRYELLAGAMFRLIAERYRDGGAQGLADVVPEIADLVGVFEPLRR